MLNDSTNRKYSLFRSYAIVIYFILILTVLTACGQDETQMPTESIDQQYTVAAQTVIAEMTRLAPTETPVPTETDPISTSTIQPTVTQTQTPTQTTTATSTPAEGVPELPGYRIILDDDFSDETGWYTSIEEDYGFRYTENGYQIYVNLLNAAIWSIRDVELTDSRIEVHAEQTDGPNDGYYGVTCRHLDSDNYYGLVISNNGQYGILRMAEGEFEFIHEGFAPDGIINPDGSNNVIGDCIGNTLTLYANGSKITALQDHTFASGVFGMLVGSRRQEGVEVAFSHITVSSP